MEMREVFLEHISFFDTITFLNIILKEMNYCGVHSVEFGEGNRLTVEIIDNESSLIFSEIRIVIEKDGEEEFIIRSWAVGGTSIQPSELLVFHVYPSTSSGSILTATLKNIFQDGIRKLFLEKKG